MIHPLDATPMQSEEAMSKELIERLRELSASRKPYATGAHGQIIGMESYRIVANGFALECIDEAADRIEELERAQFEQESDQLREHVTMLRDALLTCSVGDFSTGHVIPPSFDEKLVEEALAATEPKP